uniref:Uncharacterized protein MANES_05G167800 n=1 Tax=Rhizophora mucronata TaxID=61149 RepID=A0A2P2L1B6_RHIMU
MGSQCPYGLHWGLIFFSLISGWDLHQYCGSLRANDPFSNKTKNNARTKNLTILKLNKLVEA